MFSRFFFQLRDHGVPVSPTGLLRLHKAMALGQVTSLEDLYYAARTIWVKSERLFDRYDQVFAHYFKGAELPAPEEWELDEAARLLLAEWLKSPEELAAALGLPEEELAKLSPDELIEYFKQRLDEQDGAHHGGNNWIGTQGTSPVGHNGWHPGGMRIGGRSGNRSAVKVALDRRYRDYEPQGPLTQAMIGEALKRLRKMVPVGPRDVVNVDETIRQTMRKAGEIEIVFDRGLRDRLSVLLLIDNGGWSMDPYVDVVQTLFDHARYQFKDLRTMFFHNTIYDQVWKDASRIKKSVTMAELLRLFPQTRLVVVGDASMAPYELLHADGGISWPSHTGRPSHEQLRLLAGHFHHVAWLNPVPEDQWRYTRTIGIIRDIMPMFPLSLEGLDQAVGHLLG